MSPRNASFTPSSNDYDWLGEGMYFWENNPERALEYAKEMIRRNRSKAKPAVVGAVLNLGYCLNLTEKYHLDNLREAYNLLKLSFDIIGKQLPQNKQGPDKLLRRLDCAVIKAFHGWHDAKKDTTSFDSVKAVFQEGVELYPGAMFKEKTHSQIAILNPNCIKGYFWPRAYTPKYRKL